MKAVKAVFAAFLVVFVSFAFSGMIEVDLSAPFRQLEDGAGSVAATQKNNPDFAALVEKYDIKELMLSISLSAQGSGMGDITVSADYIFQNPDSDFVSDGAGEPPKGFFRLNMSPFNFRESGKGRSKYSFGDFDYYTEFNAGYIKAPCMNAGSAELVPMLKRIGEMKLFCEENGIEFAMAIAPLESGLSGLQSVRAKDIYASLAKAAPLWSFSGSYGSMPVQAFCGGSDLKKTEGDRVFSRLFESEFSLPVEQLGQKVTEENIDSVVDNVLGDVESYTSNTRQIAVLLYHHFTQEESNSISQALFEEQMKALHDNGYTAVGMKDLLAYVEEGAELPEKAVCITIDDGYMSNYEIAYPILKKYNMKATIFVIGSSVGKSVYKETEFPITPHFGFSEMKEMSDSGLISIQSHTYDMHQSEMYENPDSGAVRWNALKRESETEEEYEQYVAWDIGKSISDIENCTGREVFALAYPYGLYDELCQENVLSAGIKMTFSTTYQKAVLIKGFKGSLYGINRFSIGSDTSVEKLLELVE